MDIDYSYWQRLELKQELLNVRIDLADNGFGFTSRCAICGKLLTNGCDMHEAIITRGDISGQKQLQPLIMVRENCVLVCPGGSGSPCHREAGTKEGQIKAIQNILTFESIEDIEIFLHNLNQEMKGTQVQTALNLVKEVVNG